MAVERAEGGRGGSMFEVTAREGADPLRPSSVENDAVDRRIFSGDIGEEMVRRWN